MSITSRKPVGGTASSADRLRVLHVIDSLVLGGAEQLLLTLATHIDASRFDMRVCSLSPDDAGSPISVALSGQGIPVYRAWDLHQHDVRHLLWLTMLMRREAIDLVHTHLAYGNVMGLLAAAASGRLAVATIHSEKDHQRGLTASKQWLQGALLRRRASVIVACSAEVEASARTRFRIPPGKLMVLPNGIETAAYRGNDPEAAHLRRAELLDLRAGPLVVAVGRLSPQKGHETLVDATALLRERFPALRVVIVGRDGDNSPLVRERLAAHGLLEHVVLAGERADVPAVLAAAEPVVHASLYEGLPLALLEAMAAGLPVVATAVGGVPNAADQGRCARLVAPGDPRALAEAMAELLGDPDGAAELGTRAAAFVRARYEAADWARRLE